jgi:hypothetical protein
MLVQLNQDSKDTGSEDIRSMERHVALLTMAQVDWKQFISTCRETVGYSPTRGLDACVSPTHKDPAAFLACIDLQNKPLEAIRHGYKRGLFRHFFFGFSFLLSENELRELHQRTRLALFSEASGRDYLVIASGTMDQWHDAVICMCQIDCLYELRVIFNTIYNLFLNMGFREAFPYSKIEQQDGTFAIK